MQAENTAAAMSSHRGELADHLDQPLALLRIIHVADALHVAPLRELALILPVSDTLSSADGTPSSSRAFLSTVTMLNTLGKTADTSAGIVVDGECATPRIWCS